MNKINNPKPDTWSEILKRIFIRIQKNHLGSIKVFKLVTS
jgi:hypothetical protein